MSLDRHIRACLLEAAGENLGAVHPAWTSPKDSGLYAAAVRLATQRLRKANIYAVDGEDAVMTLLANPDVLRVAGEQMRKDVRTFRAHPKGALDPKCQFGKFFQRRLKDIIAKENHVTSISAEWEAPIHEPVPMFEFCSWLLRSGHPLGKQLERCMRHAVGEQYLPPIVIDLLVSGGDLKAISAIAQDAGRCASGNAVQKFKSHFIPQIQALVGPGSEYREVYETWASTFNG